MTRRLTALVCVFLVATAGCAGITGQEDATTTTPTQTTAETTEATTATPTTESAEQLAPGVTTEGVEDARALADAHQSALRDGGFVKHLNATRTNGSAIAAQNQRFAVENESLWRLTTTGEGVGVALGVTNGTYDTYADSSRVLWQLENETAESTSYGVMSITIDGDDQSVPPNQTFEQDTYQSLYERSLVYTLAANANSVEALDGSGAAVRLSGVASNPPTAFTRSGDVEFTATVSADGLVQSIELSYPSEDATVKRSLSFDTDVGDPVEQPNWYETALNETDLNESSE